MNNWNDILKNDESSAKKVAHLFDDLVNNLRKIVEENDGFDKPDTVGKKYAEIEDKIWELFDDLFRDHNLH